MILLIALMVSWGAATGCNGPESVRLTNARVPDLAPVTCEMVRGECTREAVRDTFVLCDLSGYETSTFVATGCPMDGEGGNPAATCRRVFCSDQVLPLYRYSECRVTAATVTTLPMAGVCQPDPAATGLARASYFRRSRTCQSDGTVCTTLVQNTSRGIDCVDVSTMAAADFLPAASDERDRGINIIQFEPNSPACVDTGESVQFYSVPAGPVASVSGARSGGTTADPISANLSAVSGVAVTSRACDIDGGCTFTLERLRLTLADATIAGIPLTNLVVRTSVAAPLRPDSEGSALRIDTGALRLIVEGRMAGGPRSFFNVQNRGPMFLGVHNGEINLSGRSIFLGIDAVGRPLPITIDVNLRAVTAPQQTADCLRQPPRLRLFGFEELETWTSRQANLSTVTTPLTEGCGALSATGQGYMTIDGGEFTTIGLALGTTPAIRVDLFIPENQPNRYWLGALQLYLTCPSANAFNQYIGQVELTGRPTNRYATLTFPLPALTANTLRQPLDDCRFSLALNVNKTGQAWILDNLRITP